MNQDTKIIAAEVLVDLNNLVIQCSYQSSKNFCSICLKTFNTIDPTRIRNLWIKHLETDHMIYFSKVHEEEKPLCNPEKKQKSIVVSNDNLDLDKIKIYKAKENLHHENPIQKSVHDKKKHQTKCNFDAQIIKVNPDLNQSVVSEEKQLNNDNLGGEMISNLNLKCKKCQGVFPSDESLSRHINNVNGDCYDQPQNTNSNEERAPAAAKLSSYCDICKKDLSSKSNLTKHIEVVHEGIMPYQCEVCNEDFSQKAKLQIHFRHHHPNIFLPEIRMKFSCSKCSNSFSTEIKLNEHEKKHDSNISCDICKKPFTTTKAVKRHKKSCHPEFKCLHCNSSFDDVVLLKSHVTKVHEGKKLL